MTPYHTMSCSAMNNITGVRAAEEIYEISSIETEYNPGYCAPYEERPPIDEVTLKMTASGFNKLIHSVEEPRRFTHADLKPVRHLIDAANNTDGNIFIVSFDQDKIDVETARELFNVIRNEVLPNKRLVFLPKAIDIYEIGRSELEKIQQEISEIVDDLKYDHIMGF